MSEFCISLNSKIEIETAQEKYGQKTANILYMIKEGVPSSEGFIVTSDALDLYKKNKRIWVIWDMICAQISELQEKTSKSFGDDLFLSISAPFPIPNIVGIGMNDKTANRYANKTKQRDLPYYLYPELIETLSSTAFGIERSTFVNAKLAYMRDFEIKYMTDFKPTDYINITKLYKGIFYEKTGSLFPQCPYEQLNLTMNAIFHLMNSNVGSIYNATLTNDEPFSIIVREYQFGIEDCHSYAAYFHINDISLKKTCEGDFSAFSSLIDISYGFRETAPANKIDSAYPDQIVTTEEVIKKVNDLYDEPMTLSLVSNITNLYIVDLYKSTVKGSDIVKYYEELRKAGKSVGESLFKVSPNTLRRISFPQLECDATEILATGIECGIGVSQGKLCFSNEDVRKRVENGEKAILAKSIITGLDIEYIEMSDGVISICGNEYCDGINITRALGKPGIFNVDAIFNPSTNELTFGENVMKDGDDVTIVGSRIFKGSYPLINAPLEEQFAKIVNESYDSVGIKPQIYANVASIDDIKIALTYEADSFYITNDGKNITDLLKECGDNNVMVKINSDEEDVKNLVNSFKETDSKAKLSILVSDINDENIKNKIKPVLCDLSIKVGVEVMKTDEIPSESDFIAINCEQLNDNKMMEKSEKPFGIIGKCDNTKIISLATNIKSQFIVVDPMLIPFAKLCFSVAKQ